MLRARIRAVGVACTRYGVVYPAVVSGGAFLASTRVKQPFGTVLFVLFVVAAAVTAIGAWNNPSSNAELRSRNGFGGGIDSDDAWDDSLLAKLVLFDLGLAVALTIHAFWWSSAG